MTQPVDYGTFQVGAVALPLPTGSPNMLLQDADPSLFFALDFWAWLIGQYVGPRVAQVCSASGIKDQKGVAIAQAVAQQYPWDPMQELGSTQFGFPLLAAYRKDSKYKRKTAGHEHDRGTFDLLYILPPLTAGQLEALVPVFRAVELTIREKTTQAWDPGYQPPVPGSTLGQNVWGPTCANVESIGFDEGHYGIAPGTGNLKFPFLVMSGFIVERDMPVPAQNKFAGGDLTINLTADDGTQVPGVGGFASQQAPTIASLSVASGTQAGGTHVTITGTLLLAGPPLVKFGHEYAPSVTFNSPTSITATTPAMSGGGTVDVRVTNRDGQSAVLPQSFTFTTP